MNRSKLLTLFAALCLASALLAQGSGSSMPSASSKGASPFAVTKVAKGELVEIDKDKIVVETKGEEAAFQILDITVIKAEKGADVPNRKKVTLAELKKGHRVSVKYKASDRTVLELKILKQKG